MSLVINTNSIATVTRNYLNTNQANLKTSLSRLASGKRIVDPSDDAGGLAVGNKLAATLNRNTRTQQNVQNSISFLQVQDGALTQVGKILDRMSELKTMSLDVTKNSLDIANYDAEFSQLQDQLANIRDEKFNGINLFVTEGKDLQVLTTENGDAGIAEVINIATPAGDNDLEQEEVITISGGAAGSVFEVDIDGINFKQEWTISDNDTAAALAAQINSNPILSAPDIFHAGLGRTYIAATANTNTITLKAGSAPTSFNTRVVSNEISGTITTQSTLRTDTLVLEVDGTEYKYSLDSNEDNFATAINASSLGEFLTASNDGANGLNLTVKQSVDRHHVNVKASIAETGTAAATSGSLNQTTSTQSTIVAVGISREGVYRIDTNGAGLITTSGVNLLDDDRTLSQYSVDDFTNFIQNAATARADNGAEMSRLESSHSLLTANHANIEAARSRLMDVDIAIESTSFAKHNILVQSSAAMLSQANSIPNVALQLLG